MSRLGLLRSFDFRQLFVADTISQIGTHVTHLALPLVAVMTLDASEFEVGVLLAAESSPFLLLGLPAGAWVDRLRRRSVMVSGDVARAALLGSIPIAWWGGVLTLAQLLVVAFLAGVGTVFFDVAYQSYLPHLVGREYLVEGNSKLEAVRASTQISGPAIAGGLVQWFTAPVAIVVDAVSYGLSAMFLGRIRNKEEEPVRPPDAHLGREIGEGLRFVLAHRLLRPIAGSTAVFNLCWAVAGAMTIVYLVRDLRLSPGRIGVFFSVAAVGALIGVVLVKPVVRLLGQGPAIWLSLAVFTPFALCVPLARPGWSVWLAAAGYSLVAVGIVIYNVTQVSLRQGLTPERLLGRMNATMRFLVWGTMPLGGLVGGVLGQWLGARTTLWIGLGGACLSFLFVLFSPLRTMRELPGPVTAASPTAAAV